MKKNLAGRSMFISAGIHILFLLAFFLLRGKNSNASPIIIDFSLEKTPLVAQAPASPSIPKKTQPKISNKPLAANPLETFPDTTAPDTIQQVEETVPETHQEDAASFAAQKAAYDDSIARLKVQYIEAHYTEIRDKVYHALSYPIQAQEKEWQGEVKISFFVHCDGRADSLRVLKSSGYALLDQNALEAVKRAAPYAPSPKKVEIRLPINYRLE